MKDTALWAEAFLLKYNYCVIPLLAVVNVNVWAVIGQFEKITRRL